MPYNESYSYGIVCTSRSEVVAVWLQKYVLNFPMAFFWQTFIAGPLVRNVFKIFESDKNVNREEQAA